jgi:hypothetical protein
MMVERERKFHEHDVWDGEIGGSVTDQVSGSLELVWYVLQE